MQYVVSLKWKGNNMSLFDFREMFKKFYADNGTIPFSYEGLEVLYNHLSEMDCPESYMSDIVALRCDFFEYETAEDLTADYDSVPAEYIIGKGYLIGHTLIYCF